MILVGQGGAKHRQEAVARHMVQRPTILVHLPPGEGIQGPHPAVHGIQPQARAERGGMGQGTAEECDELALPLCGPSGGQFQRRLPHTRQRCH